jgi:CRP-like cAMP-binding protein
VNAFNHTDAPKRASELLLHRYGAPAQLSESDMRLFRDLDGPMEEIPRGRELSVEGRETVSARFLISGWACRFRLLADGRRQILSFILPGDGIGICRRPSPIALSNVAALTPCLTISAGPYLQMGWKLANNPGVENALHVADALDEAHLLNHIVRLGRQTALERLSHLLLELHWRLSQVGLAADYHFALPLTQEILADATGLSIVHVNRTIQHLRRDQLVKWQNHSVTIREPRLLADLAKFKAPKPSDWS